MIGNAKSAISMSRRRFKSCADPLKMFRDIMRFEARTPVWDESIPTACIENCKLAKA